MPTMVTTAGRSALGGAVGSSPLTINHTAAAASRLAAMSVVSSIALSGWVDPVNNVFSVMPKTDTIFGKVADLIPSSPLNTAHLQRGTSPPC